MKNIHTLLCFTAVSLSLSACDFMQNNVGKYMPTIGEPCNNWQCFTDSGQAESHAKEHYWQTGSSASTANGNARTPINGSPSPAQPGVAPQPAAPSAPANPTPFDMTPEQLNEMPGGHSEEE